MHPNALTAPLLAVALSGPLLPQVGVGEPMPEVKVDASFNLERFEIDELGDLKGPAFLVEYWATW